MPDPEKHDMLHHMPHDMTIDMRHDVGQDGHDTYTIIYNAMHCVMRYMRYQMNIVRHDTHHMAASPLHKD